jgi:flagellar filament outer layer protein Flaa
VIKKIISIFILTLFIIPVYSEEVKKTDEEIKREETTRIGDKIYYQVILEDFENTEYTQKNLAFRAINPRRQKAGLKIRESLPAHTISNSKKSKKYLGVKIFGKTGDSFSIIPAKKLKINKYCRSISLWVYGKTFSGSLYIMLQDANLKSHKLKIKALNFQGWSKLTVTLPKEVIQQDEYLSQHRFIQITKIIYSPGNSFRKGPIWQYLYIDDISAMVREKYIDKQSDEW